jgi:hypothetical protein
MISRRKFIKAGVAAPAIIRLWPELVRECEAALSYNGIIAQNVFPEVPSLSQIQGPGGTNTTQMPNLFLTLGTPNTSNMFTSGTAITTKAQWWHHRAEIKAMLMFYINGRIPPSSPVVLTSQLLDVSITNSGGTMIQRTFNLATGPGAALPFFINMYLPTNASSPYGSGPYPTILTCDGASSPLALGPSNQYASSPGAVTLATLVNMGYIFCEFGKDNFSPDQRDLAPASDDTIYTTAPNGENLLLGTFQQAPKALFQMYPFDRNSGPAPNSGAGLFDVTSASRHFRPRNRSHQNCLDFDRHLSVR